MKFVQGAKIEFFVVQYNDEAGVEHTTMAMRLGEGQWVQPDGAELWMKNLQGFHKDISKQMEARWQASQRAQAVAAATPVDVTKGSVTPAERKLAKGR